MKTVTVQIGNSDDKLTQQEWSNFVYHVGNAIEEISQIHFSGVSFGDDPWQNAAWVFAIDENRINDLKKFLAMQKAAYKQDSIAWTEGDTIFI